VSAIGIYLQDTFPDHGIGVQDAVDVRIDLP
jgi:hypothetical protein